MKDDEIRELRDRLHEALNRYWHTRFNFITNLGSARFITDNLELLAKKHDYKDDTWQKEWV